jgi:hypothetical protein
MSGKVPTLVLRFNTVALSLRVLQHVIREPCLGDEDVKLELIAVASEPFPDMHFVGWLVVKHKDQFPLRLRVPYSFPSFRAFCGELRAAQDQESMFDAAEFALQNLTEASTVRLAPRPAGVRTHPRLPKPQVKGTGLGATLEAFMAMLLQKKERNAALAVGTLYEALSLAGIASPPEERLIPRTFLTAGDTPSLFAFQPPI